MLAVLASRETSGIHKHRRHDNEAYYLGTQEAAVMSTCEVVDDMGDSSIPYSVSFSKSGKHMSISSEDGVIRMLDTTRELPPTTSMGSTSSWQAHNNAVFSTTWVKDDSCLLSCSGDASVKLWDLETEQQLRRLEYHRQSVKLLAVLPSSDGSVFVSGSRDGSLALWDLREPGSSPISTVEGAHAQAMLSNRATKRLTTRSITGAVFLPGTSLLLSSGAGDTTVKTWDIRRLRCLSQKDGKKPPSTSELSSFSCRGKSEACPTRY